MVLPRGAMYLFAKDESSYMLDAAARAAEGQDREAAENWRVEADKYVAMRRESYRRALTALGLALCGPAMALTRLALWTFYGGRQKPARLEALSKACSLGLKFLCLSALIASALYGAFLLLVMSDNS
jgi:hypothetical protein